MLDSVLFALKMVSINVKSASKGSSRRLKVHAESTSPVIKVQFSKMTAVDRVLTFVHSATAKTPRSATNAISDST